jgi:hypothetical protein
VIVGCRPAEFVTRSILYSSMQAYPSRTLINSCAHNASKELSHGALKPRSEKRQAHCRPGSPMPGIALGFFDSDRPSSSLPQSQFISSEDTQAAMANAPFLISSKRRLHKCMKIFRLDEPEQVGMSVCERLTIAPFCKTSCRTSTV